MEFKKWSEHERYYADVCLKAGARWQGFAGRCLLIGIELGWTLDSILEYIFESVHGLSLGEIPESVETIREDMLLYKVNIESGSPVVDRVPGGPDY